MPVVTQRQVPIEVPQIQCVDKIVGAPVVVTRGLITDPILWAGSRHISVVTQLASRKKISMETESAGSADEQTQCTVSSEGEWSLEVDETRERSAAEEGESLDLLQAAPDMEACGSHLQATAEEERIVDWTKTCARSAELSSSWYVGKESST